MLIDLGMIPRADGSAEPIIAQYIDVCIRFSMMPDTNLIARLVDIGYDINAVTDAPDREDPHL